MVGHEEIRFSHKRGSINTEGVEKWVFYSVRPSGQTDTPTFFLLAKF